MQRSLYGVSYVDWMLHCTSVVIEVGVGSVQFERAWLLRLNRVCREEENLIFCFGALFNSTLNFTQSG